MGPSIMQCGHNEKGKLKSTNRSPQHKEGRDREGRGGVTKFISYYTVKCDLVMTSVKFNQVFDSVLLKVNQCPSWCEMRKFNLMLLFLLLLQLWMQFAWRKPKEFTTKKRQILGFFSAGGTIGKNSIGSKSISNCLKGDIVHNHFFTPLLNLHLIVVERFVLLNDPWS